MNEYREAILKAKRAALADWLPRTVEVNGVRVARVTVDVTGAATDSPEAVAFVRLTSEGKRFLPAGWNS